MVQPTVRSDTKRTRIRRIQLLDAALETFVEQGYSDVGVAEIVARIGCSHGTFYNYFDNKRDALDALLSGAGRTGVGGRVAQAEAAVRVRVRRRPEQSGAASGRIRERAPARPDLPHHGGAWDRRGSPDTVVGSYGQLGQLCGQYIRHGIDDGYLREDINIEFAGRRSCRV